MRRRRSGGRFQPRLFDPLDRPAQQIFRRLGGGHVIQKAEDFFCGIQTGLELSFGGSGENHLHKRIASRCIRTFEQEIHGMPIFGIETLIHDIPEQLESTAPLPPD